MKAENSKAPVIPYANSRSSLWKKNCKKSRVTTWLEIAPAYSIQGRIQDVEKDEAGQLKWFSAPLIN